MTFLGIDPSLNGTGLCLLEPGQPPYLETVHVGKRRDAERLMYIRDRARLLVEKRPLFVAIENYSYNSVSRHFRLGEVGGVLRLLALEHQIPYVEVAPALLKKFATGDARAEKEAIIAFVGSCGVDVEDDNQADAFVLAQIAHDFYVKVVSPIRFKYEVLHVLRNPKVKSVRRARKRVKNFL